MGIDMESGEKLFQDASQNGDWESAAIALRAKTQEQEQEIERLRGRIEELAEERERLQDELDDIGGCGTTVRPSIAKDAERWRWLIAQDHEWGSMRAWDITRKGWNAVIDEEMEKYEQK